MKSFVGGLIALILSVSVDAEPLLEGRVRLSSGQPAVGVQVRLFDLTDLRRFVGTTTDEAGRFVLPLQAFSTDRGTALPAGFALGQNYPNPFNPSTVIPYQLTMAARVRLEVFNVLGQRMATLVDEERPAGLHTAAWDATDAAGQAVAAGVYIYRLTADGGVLTRRMVLVDGQAGMVAGAAPVAATSSTDAADRKYGLAVAGPGVETYIDVDFGAGMVPMELVVEAMEPRLRGKVLTGGILGDVNGDGQVDLADALAVALYIIDSSITPPNNGDIALGDVNADGQFTTADVLLIATYSANPSDPSLPAGLGQSITDAPDVADRSTDQDAADYSTWNLPEGAVARLGKGTAGAVAFSPDGQVLAVAGSLGIWLYDVATSRELALLARPGHTAGASSISFSPDGSLLVSGDRDGNVIFWDISSRSQVATLQGHTSGVSSVLFSPDGSLLVSGGWDGNVIVWDVSSRTQIVPLPHPSEVFSMSFSPDGSLLASGVEDGVIVWDISSQRPLAALPHTGWIGSVSFSPDGSLLASGGGGVVIVWDVSSRTRVATLPYDGVGTVSFSPDGSLLASGERDPWGGEDGDVTIWDVSSRSQVATLPHTEWVWSVSFSPDGSLLASGVEDGVIVWDVLSWTQLAILPHTDGVGTVSFSPDGSLLASGERDPWGGEDGDVTIWDVSGRSQVAILQGHTSRVWSISFSPDGLLLASGGRAGDVILWDVSGRSQVATLPHTSEVFSVSFSPDGSLLASGVEDGDIIVWDVSGRSQVATLPHTSEVFSVSFSPDGSLLASGGRDGAILLWRRSSIAP